MFAFRIQPCQSQTAACTIEQRSGGGHVAFGCNLRKRGRGWGWVRYPLIGPQPPRSRHELFSYAPKMETAIATVVDRSFEGTQNAHCLIKDSPFWLPHLETGYLSFSVCLPVWRRWPSSPASPFSPSPIIQRRERGRQNRDASLLIDN